MKLRPPLSPAERAELRQQGASRIMVADDFTLLQLAAPLGLLERPEGHDAGKPLTKAREQRHLGHLTETPMNGIESIAAERQRQIEIEGWTPTHDDKHIDGELAYAGGCYALLAHAFHDGSAPRLWPWGNECWKPQTPRADLVRAGALIAAEIDRLDRLDRTAAEKET